MPWKGKHRAPRKPPLCPHIPAAEFGLSSGTHEHAAKPVSSCWQDLASSAAAAKLVRERWAELQGGEEGQIGYA